MKPRLKRKSLGNIALESETSRRDFLASAAEEAFEKQHDLENELKGYKNIEDESGISIATLYKAFEIIKEKKVDVYMLLVCFEDGGLERYNYYLDTLYLPECHLDQEQFDLLKEVLL